MAAMTSGGGPIHTSPAATTALGETPHSPREIRIPGERRRRHSSRGRDDGAPSRYVWATGIATSASRTKGACASTGTKTATVRSPAVARAANDAPSDLAPIGDEDRFESHRRKTP